MSEISNKTLIDIKKEVLDSNLSDETKIYIIENLKDTKETHQSPYYIKEVEKPRGIDKNYFLSPNTPITC